MFYAYLANKNLVIVFYEVIAWYHVLKGILGLFAPDIVFRWAWGITFDKGDDDTRYMAKSLFCWVVVNGLMCVLLLHGIHPPRSSAFAFLP